MKIPCAPSPDRGGPDTSSVREDKGNAITVVPGGLSRGPDSFLPEKDQGVNGISHKRRRSRYQSALTLYVLTHDRAGQAPTIQRNR